MGILGTNIFKTNKPGLGKALGYIDPLGKAINKKDPFGLFKKNDAPSTFAQDTYAAITRDQWYNYMNSIGLPQEQALQKFATDPTVVANSMAEASRDATGAFDRQGVATQRELSNLGLTLNADEQQAAARSTNLARSLADVNAQNTARRATRGLRQSIIGNPTPRIESPA